jgi:NitT/TauT family transport system permease protein
VLVFFVVFFNAFQGVREVDELVISNARILGANRRQVTSQVVVPSALTWIIASMHTSFGFAIVGAVVGEYLGSAHGLGNMIAVAQGTFNPNGIYAAMFILTTVALIAEYLITHLENRLISWRPRRRDELASYI